MYGPWTGALANEGDTVELQRPVKGDSSGSVSYTLVDAVHYFPAAPWPQLADFLGTPGLSISRIGPSFFGDDPANWIATLPTPGQQDSDGDGLPDWWESLNGLDPHSAAGNDGTYGDPDGDGFPNYEEFLAGTSPRDVNSFLFLQERLNGKDVFLDFTPLAGRSYTVYYSDDLKSGWHPLRNFSLITNTAPMSVREQSSKPARFYKLQIP
jgi:hypothetical protein